MLKGIALGLSLYCWSIAYASTVVNYGMHSIGVEFRDDFVSKIEYKQLDDAFEFDRAVETHHDLTASLLPVEISFYIRSESAWDIDAQSFVIANYFWKNVQFQSEKMDKPFRFHFEPVLATWDSLPTIIELLQTKIGKDERSMQRTQNARSFVKQARKQCGNISKRLIHERQLLHFLMIISQALPSSD